MATNKEISVEEKLRALYDLQLIDSRIDEIKNVRGELPLEVQDLEDEVAGMNTRLEKLTTDLEVIEESIKGKKLGIESSTELIKKYTAQQDKVRNNREYNALSKEVEFQELEIKLSDKKIAQYKETIENKTVVLDELKGKIKDRKSHLKSKNSELGEILKETEKEETLLIKKSKEFGTSLDKHLYAAYNRIRTKVKNGLAVVAIERGASGGSYFTIPPQVQLEIANRKKITIDEHSGRILVDAALAEEEKEKMDKLFS